VVVYFVDIGAIIRSEAVEIQENTLNNFQSFLGEEHVLNNSMAASIHKDGRFASIKNY